MLVEALPALIRALTLDEDPALLDDAVGAGSFGYVGDQTVLAEQVVCPRTPPPLLPSQAALEQAGPHLPDDGFRRPFAQPHLELFWEA